MLVIAWSKKLFRHILHGAFLVLMAMGVLVFPSVVSAYSTNMSATVVVGQVDFASGTANQGGSTSQTTLANPYDAIIVGNKLIVSDGSNNRVLIYNSLPTSNNAPADVVIGQANFTDSSANRGGVAAANTLSLPGSIFSDGTKLFVVDGLNHRVLIYNTIPTGPNAAADVVVGQPDFSGNSANQGGVAAANTLNAPSDVWVDGSKMIIADNTNHRVLIYNTVPTGPNASADLVIGQTNFSNNSANQGGSPAANNLWFPSGVFTDHGKLLIAELNTGGNGNKRVLVFNQIPTTNNASADVVVGQPNFTSNTAYQGVNATASTIGGTRFPWSYNGRLFIPEDHGFGNNRVLVFNQIPTVNGTAADLVIGQPNFVSYSANQGGSRAANTLNRPTGGFATADKLVISDRINSRVLIYDNQVLTPDLSLSNSPQSITDGLLRFSGNASVRESNAIASVQYAVNGGGFTSATPSDGSFNSTNESYFFDVDPQTNQFNDAAGKPLEGFTVRVKSSNNNTDTTHNLFYFSPFLLNAPNHKSSLSTTRPNFDFSVNKQRVNLQSNLSKYQVQIRKIDQGVSTAWETYIDAIPVDHDGVYETQDLWAFYSEQSSRISVYSKTRELSGVYEWKVTAVDVEDHAQDTETRLMYVNTSPSLMITKDFPLALLHITGVGKVNMSTFVPQLTPKIYLSQSLQPVFYGIAYVNAQVTLSLSDQKCISSSQSVESCTKTYQTTANNDSRFGVNVLPGDLRRGTAYTVNATVSLNGSYNQLPPFTLLIPKARN